MVKGCIGDNRGWRRSPLGGASTGYGYYLWWAPAGSPQVTELADGNRSRNIWVRAVRDHDTHAPLAAGDTNGSYFPLSQKDLDSEDETFVSQPWTCGQNSFVTDSSAVRLLHGHPGSGKTTALWRAIEARKGQRVLYVSWSRDLTTLAAERFAAFAPTDVDVVTYDFVTLLGLISRTDVPRLTYDQSRAAFAEALAQTRISPARLGQWADREDALYAELRAILLGRAIPGEPDCIRYNGDLWRVDDDAYRRIRGSKDGVGESAADAFLTIAPALERRADLIGVFPELAAAAESIRRLRLNDLPDGFANFDRIAVDEIQDLTLIEIAVVVELCRAIARESDYAPWVLLAGDEGQTVRPSGFEWSRLKDLLHNQLWPAKEFLLDATLRAPQKIARVDENAAQLYIGINKGIRPANQHSEAGGEQIEAELFYVDVPDIAEAITTLAQLNDIENLEVISPESDVPEWLPIYLRSTVLTPLLAKGLEYQIVCVLNPGLLLKNLTDEINGRTDSPELEAHYRRTAIDRLRVALSRATETLVFMDVEADETVRTLSRNLLPDEAAICSPDYLVEHFTDAYATTEERVQLRINQARLLIDNAPERAWERSIQALRLLNSAYSSDESIEQTVHFVANTNLLATAARLLVDGMPPDIQRDDVVRMGGEAAVALASERDADAFRELVDWSGRPGLQPFALLNAGLALTNSGAWFRSALPSVFQTLLARIDRYAADPAEAAHFGGDVEGWLRMVGYAGDVADRAKSLRGTAGRALIQAGKTESVEDWLRTGGCGQDVADRAKAVRYAAAEALIQEGETESVERFLAQTDTPDWELRAILSEARSRFEEAIDAYERAGLSEDASRVRKAAAKDYFDKGQVHLASQDWDKAIQDLESAIALDSDDADFYNSRGFVWYSRNELGQAILDYDRAIAINPYNADFYNGRGLAHRWKVELNPAIQNYEHAISLNGDNGDFYRNRGDAYARKCEFDRAILDYDRAITLNPNDANCYIGRGFAHRWKGDSDGAERDFDRASRMR